MSHLRVRGAWQAAAVVLGVLATGLVPSSVQAQGPGSVWLADDVSGVDLGAPNCLRRPRVNGFGFAPDGMPLVGWTQVEGCGGNNSTYWAEKADGQWTTHPWTYDEFWSSPSGSAHEFGLGPNGDPYLFMMGGDGNSLTYWTFRADLRAFAAGDPGALLNTGEHVGSHQECVYVRYRLATDPTQLWPARATRRGDCGDAGPLRYEGANLVSYTTNRAHDVTVGPDGRAHLAYVDNAGQVFYVRSGIGPVPVATVVRNSDDIGLAVSADGAIHLVVRGFSPTADYDRGLVGYLRSTDDGATWTLVDTVDASRATYGLSMQLDAAGAPAVAYWRYGYGLMYTSRASGAWDATRIVNPGWSGVEWVTVPRLRFDAAGVPHVAYYDWSANRIRVSSPAAAGVETAVDLHISGNASPNPTMAGTAVSYTLTLGNDSAREASGVRVRVTLPPGTTATNIDPAPLSNAGGVLTFDRWRIAGGGTGQDRLSAQATGTITFDLNGLSTGISEMPVVVSSLETDARLDDNSAMVTARINEATCALPASGRMAWWPGDGTARNYGSGSAYHGTPVGAVSYGPGAVGQAFQFDGATGYVKVPNGYNEYYWPRNSAMSVAAWFSTGVTSAAVQAIASMDDMANSVCCGSPQGYAAWYLYVQDGVVRASMRQNPYGSAGVVLVGTTPVADGEFHHAALVIDIPALQARLYVDGALEASAPLASGWTMSNGDFQAEELVIGGAQQLWADGYRYFFNGAVDDVALYHRALTAAEVAQAASGPARVECGAAPANQAPSAADDNVKLVAAAGVVVDVLSNDTDPDGDTLVVDGIDVPAAFGTATVEGAGSVRYVPGPAYAGADHFSYRVRDDAGLTAVATVSISTPAAALADARITASDPVMTDSGYPQVTLTVSNLGPAIATGVQVTGASADAAFLPPAIAALQPGESCLAGGQGWSCQLAPIAPGEERTLTVGVSPASSGDVDLQTTYAVTAEQLDGDVSNNAVELRIDMAPGCAPNCPAVSVVAPESLTTYIGREVAFDVSAVVHNAPGYVAELDHSALPAGASLTQVTVGATTTYRFRWTPFPTFNADGSPYLGGASVCFQARATAVSGPALTSFGQSCVVMTPGLAQLLPLAGVMRDFTDVHPDFASPAGDAGSVLVSSTLGPGRKPVFSPGGPVTTIEGDASFGEWWTDGPGRVTAEHTLYLTNALQPDPRLFMFDSTAFKPHSWSPDGFAVQHSDYFTFEAHGRAPYLPGQVLRFTSADDLWVFVNGRLAVDLGGVHAPASAQLDLDARAADLGLVPGETFALDLFYAHRGTHPAALTVQVPEGYQAVEVSVNEPPQLPVLGETIAVEGTPISRRVQATDPEGDPVTFDITGLPPGMTATAVLTATPPYLDVVGTPPAGSAGAYDAVLTVSDGVNVVTAPWRWVVRLPNRAPTAVDDAAVQWPTAPNVWIPVLANDSDPDGDALRVTSVTQPSSGTVWILTSVAGAPQELQFTPDGARAAPYDVSFTYTVTDRPLGIPGLTSTATVTVRVLSTQPDLSVSIAAHPTGVRAENQATPVTAVVIVRNNSAVTIDNVELTTELLNAGSFAGAVPAPAATLARSLRWPLDPMTGGATSTVLVRASLPASDRITARVTRDPREVNSLNNTALMNFTEQPDFCFLPTSAAAPFRWRLDGSLEASDSRLPTSRVGGALEPGVPEWIYSGAMAGSGTWRLGGATAARINDFAGLLRVPSLTIAAWTKPTLAAGGSQTVMAHGDGNVTGYWMGVTDGRPALHIRHADGSQTRLLGAAIPGDAWHHLAGTFDGASARLYVNGQLVAQRAADSPIFYGTADTATLGGLVTPTWTVDLGLEGLLDDVMVFDQALTDTDVAALVAGTPETCFPAQQADLSLTAEALPSIVAEGATVTYRFSVTNHGPGYVSDAKLTNVLPAGARFLSVSGATLVSTSPPASVAAGPSQTLGLATLPHGATAVIDVRVAAPAFDGVFENTATLFRPAVDGAPADNVASATFTVWPASCFAAPDQPCDVNDHPSLQNPGRQTGVTGDAAQLDLVVRDPDGPSLTFSATGLPPGLGIDPSTGRISGVLAANSDGVHRVSIVVSDGTLATAESFEWHVSTRVTFTLGQGAAVTINGVLCDARAGAAQCVITFAPGTGLTLATHTPPAGYPNAELWTVVNGLRQAIVTDRSGSVDLLFIGRYHVTIEGASPPYSQVLSASAVWDAMPHFEPRAGLVCESAFSPQCTGWAPVGDTVRLTPLDTESRVFDAFVSVPSSPVSCGGANPCAFTLDRPNAWVIARYVPRPMTLTLDVGAGGRVRFGDGQICDGAVTGATCTATFLMGSTVTLAPESAPGNQWLYGGRTSSGAVLELPRPLGTLPASFTMNGDATVAVTFMAPLRIALPGLPGSWDYLLQHPGPGVPDSAFPLIWSPQAPVMSCAGAAYGATCTGYATWGQAVTMQPRDSMPYSFVGWSGACTGTGVCTVRPGIEAADVVGRFNSPPFVSGAFPEVTLQEDLDLVIGLPGPFRDSDGTDTLTFSAISSNPALLGVTIAAGQLTLRPQPDQFGSATVTVTATDPWGLSASAPLAVIVRPVNDPPRLDPIADLMVVSGTPARVVLTGMSAGPGPESTDAVTVSGVVSSAPSVTGTVTEQSGVLQFTPPARSTTASATITVTVRDPQGATASRSFTVTVTAANTQPGAGVQVAAAGPMATSPISVTFAGVSSPGQTSYTVEQNVFAPPDGFRFGDPPITFDITTTAGYTAPLLVCIDYGVAAYANPAALRLFHYEKGQWVDRTVSVDTRTRRVCGSVTSLSPFALAEPIAIEGRMHGEAEIHAGGREYEVRFRIAEGRIGSERGSLALRVRTPTHGRGAAQVDRFETTAIEALVFWDDPAFVAGRTKQPRPPADSAIVTGSGRWNGVDGHTFVARAVDQGEPGRGRDRFAITVRAPSGAVVAEVDAAIDKGNIQSDRLDRRHWR